MTEFVLTEEIETLGVSRIVTTQDYFYVYNSDKFVQSKYYGEESLEKTLHELKESMIDSKAFGDQKAVERIVFLISEIWVKSVEDTSQGKEKPEEEESKSQVYKRRSLVAEAIIVGDRPRWLVSSFTSENSKGVMVSVEDSMDISIDDEKTILKPPSISSYVNRPYVFNSEEELESLIKEAGMQTLDSLFIKAKIVVIVYSHSIEFHVYFCRFCVWNDRRIKENFRRVLTLCRPIIIWYTILCFRSAKSGFINRGARRTGI